MLGFDHWTEFTSGQAAGHSLISSFSSKGRCTSVSSKSEAWNLDSGDCSVPSIDFYLGELEYTDLPEICDPLVCIMPRP